MHPQRLIGKLIRAGNLGLEALLELLRDEEPEQMRRMSVEELKGALFEGIRFSTDRRFRFETHLAHPDNVVTWPH